MGLTHSAGIVTDGLVLCLDAGNPRSYPQTGSIWFDISGNNNHGTNSNMTYSTNNNGYFTFNGSTSVSIIPNSPSLNPTTGLTIESWVYFIANSADFIFEKGNVNTQYSLFSHGTDIVFRTFHSGEGNYHSQTQSKSSVGLVNNTWSHIVGSWDGTTKRIYINGELKNSVAKGGDLITRTTGAAVGRFGGTSTGYYFDGNIAKINLYSKGLSALEIQQNFNATRGRFGI